MNNLDYVTADIESPLAMMKMDITDMPFEIILLMSFSAIIF